MKEVYKFEIRIRTRLPGITTIFPKAAMNKYSCANGQEDSTCTIPLAFMLTKPNILHIGCSVLAPITHMTCPRASFGTANTLPLVMSVVLLLIAHF